MKQLTILWAFFFTLICFTNGFPINGDNCLNELVRFQPCVGELFSLTHRQRPISSSCCDTILDMSRGHCPHLLPLYLLPHSDFLKGQAPPPPPPPGGNHKYNCAGYRKLGPCFGQMMDHYLDGKPITSSCCATILDVFYNECPHQVWADHALKCRDYCENQSHSAAPPPISN
ncbi:Prolamin-like domain containing protein [Trema orientale]|uniref:Prolamin-like domain containing protein n=1 Tax=Trema orientale TaxID=63057 RepID=A0A2P5DD49_TREOI|nr:Prolamin-like domain containing protein [Trema orientale]